VKIIRIEISDYPNDLDKSIIEYKVEDGEIESYGFIGRKKVSEEIEQEFAYLILDLFKDEDLQDK
jgi:hypothetical protein